VTIINDENIIDKILTCLRQDPSNPVLMNRLAIAYFENYQYDEALEQFKKAVDTRRTVQALNNLAWFYLYEGEKDLDGHWVKAVDKATPLLEEAVHDVPRSDFPYSLLGEAYLRQHQYDKAVSVLTTSLQINESLRALNNIGVALFHQGDYKTAADFFHRAVSLGSEPAQVNLVMSLTKVLDNEAASKMIKQLARTTVDTDYGGPLEVAQLFFAINDFENAVEYYKIAFETYSKEFDWVTEYIFALIQLHREDEACAVFNTFVNEKSEWIEEARKETDWDSEEDKQYYIEAESTEITLLTERVNAIQSGFVPTVFFEPWLEHGCYLFGCARCGYKEYEE
jgi:tetratricopeptide (TPR) repeat protein